MNSSPKNINILIADDDIGIIDNAKLVAKNYSKNNSTTITMLESLTTEDAINKISGIQGDNIDGVIVDINFARSGAPPNSEGETIIEIIEKRQLRIPIIILTASPNDAPRYPYIEILRKGDENARFICIFNYFSKIYKTGLTNIMGSRGLINSNLNSVFCESIMPQFNFREINNNQWVLASEENDSSSDRVEKSLLRNILSHLQIQLEKSNESHLLEKSLKAPLSNGSSDGVVSDNINFDRVLPSEVYLFRQFSESKVDITHHLVPGLILQSIDTKIFFMIINPACDLASKKIKLITLVEIDSIQVVFEDVNFQALNIKSKKSTLSKLFTDNFKFNFHSIPKAKFFDGGFINFQKITHTPIHNLLDTFEFCLRSEDTNHFAVMQIAPHFLKNIFSRFSAYYARQGQPEIDMSNCIDLIINESKNATEE